MQPTADLESNSPITRRWSNCTAKNGDVSCRQSSNKFISRICFLSCLISF